jgi:hypothetical protein
VKAMSQVIVYLFALIAAGCAVRSVPRSFPTGAAASPATPEAPRHPVVTTLRSHPPLPGEPTSGWTGLESPPAAPPRAVTEPVTDAPAARPEKTHSGSQGHEHHGR